MEDEKDELGLSHFEVRKYDSIMRHLSVTQVSHLFLARQTKRLRGKNLEITLCQVRTAANVLVDVLSLPKRARIERLEKASRNLRQTQDQNSRARRSHTKTSLLRLKSQGIRLEELPCCIPP